MCIAVALDSVDLILGFLLRSWQKAGLRVRDHTEGSGGIK